MSRRPKPGQIIDVAVPEKERAARADIPKALGFFDRAGKGNPPVPGDELLD